jgi:alpha-mannosidase
VTNNQRGLMIANRGLPEYEVFRDDDGTGTIALTLLRCVSWLSRDDLPERPGHAGPGMYTPGAQMPGRWTFEYSIIPHQGTWPTAYAEAHRFARPLRAMRVSGGRGEWPTERSLLAIDHPHVVMSTVKQAEDDGGTIVRVYNIGDEPAEARVTLVEPHGKVRLVDLNEEHGQAIKEKDGATALSLRQNQITTLKFDPRA